jgi:ATP-dependent helicase/DNAse subunit B
MGILETRNLDFDHLYILSANEGQMPPAQQQQTFIPFTVRKAFGLPTPEDESAVFAYHFYRLLQRAETVTFLYDTESTSMEKGEKSRYLSQLELELSRTNRAITYQQEVLNPPLEQIAVQPITVEKDQKIQQTLQQYLGYNGRPPGRAFSASAVLAYLACPLQFYFKYIAGLKEPDTMQEEIAPDVMGSIFHAAVARLYNYYWQQYGAQVTSANLDELLEQIEPCLKAAFEDVFTQDLNNVQGTNQLIRDVVYRQLQSVIERDRERTPFYLKGLEKHDYTASLSLGEQDNAPYIHLKGTVDRIEADDHGNARILDYKTGNAEINEREGIPKFFENPEKNRTSIQLLWYTYLYKQSEAAADESLHPGVYPVKGTNQGIQYLRNESGLTNDQFSQMEDQLREQLQSLFDATVPFSQTADLNTCRNCAFNPICYRQHS